MKVLVTSATGKTAGHIIPRLLERGHEVRALSRRGPRLSVTGVEAMAGDMDNPTVLADALGGVDAVIHIGPPMHPREAAIGQSLIDAMKRAGTPKFVYMSVIHPQIDDLVNHQAKLKVEGHLVHSRMDWTILQPQHYFQNIDVKAAIAAAALRVPYSIDQTLGFVDLADVAEVAVKVLTEDGHRWATYELSSDDHLSIRDAARIIAELTGRLIEPVEIDRGAVVKSIAEHFGDDAFDDRSANGFHRLFGYYDRYGITGNSNVLRWLLGRPATNFEGYCRRSLAETV